MCCVPGKVLPAILMGKHAHLLPDEHRRGSDQDLWQRLSIEKGAAFLKPTGHNKEPQVSRNALCAQAGP